jgi:excisionase family DNA binding protein
MADTQKSEERSLFFTALLEAGGAKDKARLTPEEVSNVTGAPISTVMKWLREGELKALKTGVRYRWVLPSDLEKFLIHEDASHE